MKGVTHYLFALVASAACPGNLDRAAAGDPWPILVAGIGGLLPDFIDFKLWRFLAGHDVAIAPDPLEPDPELIADALVHVMAMARHDGRRRVVKLHTIPVGAGEALPYMIALCPEAGVLTVTVGEGDDAQSATRALPASVRFDYYDVIDVDQGDGPSIAIERCSQQLLQLRFLPWHRSWSHSVLLALLAGLALAAITTPLHGAMLLVGWLSHIVLDQVGNMGCNLMWPFTRERVPGAGLCSSDSLVGNGIVIWSSIMVLLIASGARTYRCPFSTVEWIRLWLVPLAVIATPTLLAAIRIRITRADVAPRKGR